MTTQLVGWIGIAVLIVAIFLRVPMAIALLGVGIGGLALIIGPAPAMAAAYSTFFEKATMYAFTVVPLFLLMGHFAGHAGLAEEAFKMGRMWLQKLPGGLLHATIAAGAGFAAVSGSGMASCSVLSKIAIPPMLKNGVDRRMAYGVVAATGTIAQMIPPSTLFVWYGIITQQSIAKLLVAGILPGIIAAAIFMTFVFIRVVINPNLAPPFSEPVSWKQRFVGLKGGWGIILIFMLVMGGIYGGIFTPTEAAAVGAFGTFVLGLSLRKLRRTQLLDSLLNTAAMCAMLFIIILSAFVFSQFMVVSGVLSVMANYLAGLHVPLLGLVWGIVVLFVFLGTFMDLVPVFFLTLPVLFPAVVNAGGNPIWFGVVIVMLGEVSLITPPFGLNLFVLKGVVEGAEWRDIIRGIMPFIVVDIVVLAVYIAFPQISLFLPQRMLG